MNTIEQQLKESHKRKKEYIRMLGNLDLIRLALARSIATEQLNIKSLKKQLKEQD